MPLLKRLVLFALSSFNFPTFKFESAFSGSFSSFCPWNWLFFYSSRSLFSKLGFWIVILFFLFQFLLFLFVGSAISQTPIRRSSLGFSCRLYGSSSDVSLERLTVCKIRPFLKSLSVFETFLVLFRLCRCRFFHLCLGFSRVSESVVVFVFLGSFFFYQILRVFFLRFEFGVQNFCLLIEICSFGS